MNQSISPLPSEAAPTSDERLRIDERMTALGTLSAGIGHDIGNILVPIRIRLDSLSKSPLSPEAQADVESIRASAAHLQRLANGLRLLAANPQNTSGEDVSISEWWKDASVVLQSALPKTIVLEAYFPEDDMFVNISRASLTQIAFNLIQNAGEAMSGPGSIVCSFSHSGGRCEMTVSDCGTGMDDEVRRRCAEPFYTTKTRGLSTGLGLTIVDALVREAKGEIKFESDAGRGTTVRITLPGCSKKPDRSLRKMAVVNLKDRRLKAFIVSELEASGVAAAPDGRADADFFIADDAAELDRVPGSVHCVSLGEPETPLPTGLRIGLIVEPESRPKAEIIRRAIRHFAALIPDRAA